MSRKAAADDESSVPEERGCSIACTEVQGVPKIWGVSTYREVAGVPPYKVREGVGFLGLLGCNASRELI
jgi:hypothetical protein